MAAHPQTEQLASTFALPRRAFEVVAGLVGTAAIVTMVVAAWRLVTAAPASPKLLVPYGPLFTLISYALVPLGVAGTMWALKALAGLAALGCAALVWMCARRLGTRPVPAMLFFALNPLLLIYTVGGGHNDVLMALPLIAGALLILDGRPELGGAALAAAVAIKVTAGIVLPFVLVASNSRWRVLLGAAIGGLAIGVLALAAFGPHMLSVLNLLKH